MIELNNGGILFLSTMGTILTLFFLIMWLSGNEYNYMVESLDKNKYMLKGSYIFGIQLLEKIKYTAKGKWSRKRIGYCKILYGNKYADYYFRINLAQRITFTVLILISSIFLSVFMKDWLGFILGIFSAVGIVYYFDVTITELIKKRTDSITSDFSEVLSKLALLVNAGMILNEAWTTIAKTGKGVLYEEMQLVVDEIENGVSDYEAYMNFATRCNVPEVTKFAATLVQNLKKGNKELVLFLRQFAKDSWIEKKHYALRKGEEASAKLLIPIALMFLGLMLMIMIPMMGNIAI